MVEKVPTGVAAHALRVPLLVQHSQEKPGSDDFLMKVLAVTFFESTVKRNLAEMTFFLMFSLTNCFSQFL